MKQYDLSAQVLKAHFVDVIRNFGILLMSVTTFSCQFCGHRISLHLNKAYTLNMFNINMWFQTLVSSLINDVIFLIHICKLHNQNQEKCGQYSLSSFGLHTLHCVFNPKCSSAEWGLLSIMMPTLTLSNTHRLIKCKFLEYVGGNVFTIINSYNMQIKMSHFYFNIWNVHLIYFVSIQVWFWFGNFMK